MQGVGFNKTLISISQHSIGRISETNYSRHNGVSVSYRHQLSLSNLLSFAILPYGLGI